MIDIPVVLQPCVRVAAVDGIFIRSKSISDWLPVIAKARLCHSRIRLLPVPRSKSDLSPIGIVALVPDSLELESNAWSNCLLSNSVIVQPVYHAGAGLYLPCDSKLFPELNECELEELVEGSRLSFWHPAIGLVATERDELLTVSTIVNFPAESFADWNHAVDVAQPNHRVQSVRWSSPPIDDFFEQSADGIGERSSEIKIEPRPDQNPLNEDSSTNKNSPKQLLSGAGQLAKTMGLAIAVAPALIAAAAMRLVGSVLGPALSGGSAGGRGVGNTHQPRRPGPVENWIKEQLANFSRNLFEQRNKEINRLMDLLKNNPDEGLKFALPVSSVERHRGIAKPSDRLTKRSTRFSLSNLGAGGAADHWDLSSQMVADLQNQYRELAMREKRLGRFRRAAYIYAELLGDFPSAANTLEEGKYFHEAAVIYQEKLSQKRAAADCLRRGHLWHEAIELYAQLHDFEVVGDCYLEFDDHEMATTYYQRAVEKLRSTGNYIGASRVLEKKLDDVDMAVDMLVDGMDVNLSKTGEELFSLLGRHGRHADALRWQENLLQYGQTETSVADVANLLAGQFKTYPDAQVREAVANSTRQGVSDAIESGVLRSPHLVLTALQDVVTEDPILNRDCRRFVAKFKQPQIPLKTDIQYGLATVTTHNLLPFNGTWFRAIKINPDLILSVGLVQETETLCFNISTFSGTLVGQTVSKMADLSHKLADLGGLSRPSDRGEQLEQVMETFQLFQGWGNQIVASAGMFESIEPELALFDRQIGLPPKVSRINLGMCLAKELQTGYWQLRNVGSDRLLLEIVSDDKSKTVDTTFSTQFSQDFHLPIPMVEAGKYLFLGISEKLLSYNPSSLRFPKVRCLLGSQIRDLKSIGISKSYCVAAAMERGVAVVIGDGTEPHFICRDFYQPNILFTRTGHLVVQCGDRIEVYLPKNNTLDHIGSESVHGASALFQGKVAGQFGVMRHTGAYTIFDTPSNVPRY